MQLIFVCSHAHSVAVLARSLGDAADVLSGEEAFRRPAQLDALARRAREAVRVANCARVAVLVPPGARGLIFVAELAKKLSGAAVVVRVELRALRGAQIRAAARAAARGELDGDGGGALAAARRREALDRAWSAAAARATGGTYMYPCTAAALFAIDRARASRRPRVFVSALFERLGQFRGEAEGEFAPGGDWTAAHEPGEAAARPWFETDALRAWADAEELWAAGAAEYPDPLARPRPFPGCARVPESLSSVYRKFSRAARSEDAGADRIAMCGSGVRLLGGAPRGSALMLDLPRRVPPPLHWRAVTPDAARRCADAGEVLRALLEAGLEVQEAQRALRAALRRGFAALDASAIRVAVREEERGAPRAEREAAFSGRELAQVLPELRGARLRITDAGAEALAALRAAGLAPPDWTRPPESAAAPDAEAEPERAEAPAARLPDLPAASQRADRVLRELSPVLSLRVGRTMYLHYQPSPHRAPSFVPVVGLDDDPLTCDAKVLADFIDAKIRGSRGAPPGKNK